MSESYRTSVRLSRILWDFIDNSIGILGYNRSNVIGLIVQQYFSKMENRKEIESMKEDRIKIIENKKKQEAKKPENYKNKINQLLEISTEIPKNTFIEHLDIDNRFFHDHLYEWANEFNFKFENNTIIKI